MDESQHPAGAVPPFDPTKSPQPSAAKPAADSPAEPARPEVVKEIHHHHHERPRGIGLGRLLIGLVLVLVGLAYLGNSTGWFHFNLDLWRLWPLLIVILGLSMLSRRGWVGWLIGSIVTLTALVIVALAIFSNALFGSADAVTKDIAIDKIAEAATATIAINTGAGRLDISGGSDRAVSGTFESNFADLTTSSVLNGADQRVEIAVKGQWRGWNKHRNDLDLRLMPDLPTDLTINSGASDMDLDLRTMTINRLAVDTGASNLKLRLGDRAALADVKVKAGASSVAIAVPASVGVRLKLDAGVSSKDIDSDVKRVDDHNYQTDGYADAAKKIELDLDLGVASFELSQE